MSAPATPPRREAPGATTANPLEVRIGPLTLKNPVISASGCYGQALESAAFCGPKVPGALLLKTITYLPRAGNPPPRIVEVAGGILNSIGLPNKGIDRYLRETLPLLVGQPDVLILNVAGERHDEWKKLAARIGDTPGIDALELNVSCPNVEQGGLPFSRDPATVAGLVRAFKSATPIPLIVKLAPESPDIAGIARAAQEEGAVAVSAINTIRALAVDWRRRQPKLGYGWGGLSGPAIKPVALRLVHEVARAVTIPVIGIGGIQSAEDVLEFVVAGATAVQVGTAAFRDPQVLAQIVADLPPLLREAGVERLADLRGTLAFRAKR